MLHGQMQMPRVFRRGINRGCLMEMSRESEDGDLGLGKFEDLLEDCNRPRLEGVPRDTIEVISGKKNFRAFGSDLRGAASTVGLEPSSKGLHTDDEDDEDDEDYNDENDKDDEDDKGNVADDDDDDSDANESLSLMSPSEDRRK